jgi:hypothetical protein
MAEVRRKIFSAAQLPHAALLGGEIEVTALLRDAAVNGLLFCFAGSL